MIALSRRPSTKLKHRLTFIQLDAINIAFAAALDALNAANRPR
jgi:hypothetical protein